MEFDPGRWARAASDAGMKYMVFTTKHHDGFCMYDSKLTGYKITGSRTPFHTDPRAVATYREGKVCISGKGEDTLYLYYLADDLGYGDLSCYGQKTFSTPNLDRMAAEGIMFTSHYCGSTFCAPSRASLLTGKHTGHTTVRGNYPGQVLRDEEVTIAEKLKQAGYVNMFHAHNYYPEFMYRNGVKEYLKGNRTYTVNGVNPWVRHEGAGVAEEKAQYAHDHQ